MNENNPLALITVDELADSLHISRTSAYSILKRGEIKAFKLGSHYKIPQAAVDEYIARMSGLPMPSQN